jgi:hypothetical protein
VAQPHAKQRAAEYAAEDNCADFDWVHKAPQKTGSPGVVDEFV